MNVAGQQTFGPPQICFPRDEGAHPDFLVEWWYLNFTGSDASGREYGAAVAYFSPGLKILSVSDLSSRKFYQEVTGSTPRYAEGKLDLRWGGSDRWFRSGPDRMAYHIEARGRDVGLEFDYTSQKPPLLAGGDGLVRWSGGTSYYYSLTRLKSKGRLKLPDRTVDVEGIGWMDHQWMVSLGKRGWDWFSIQLEGDTEVMVWQIVNPDLSIESKDLMIMSPDGSLYHSQRPVVEAIDTWASPASGQKYGVNWRIAEDASGLDLEVRARYPDQEIRLFEVMPEAMFQFWEGSTAISGRLKGAPVAGVGHAEIVRAVARTGR